ncbi:hypothetical protein MATL_G00220160 [Megalops atlanticus]|uniref:Hsp90 co-chaperone Cdc37 n=1 Tax=Megalops atlanticus TaxID=7932 RepID=A0A9D3PJY0_MEGAT|nr:hypothetical protein MATL_G00220160 [Megalops atlanticus]
MTTTDYSVWDHIEVSDDEDDTHPNIDTPSLFRWRHQARVERMEQFEKQGAELQKGVGECWRRDGCCTWSLSVITHFAAECAEHKDIKPKVKEETEEEKEQKHRTFVEKYEKQIKHFDNPHLVCEETANYLLIVCIDLEVEEKHALMEQVSHQTIVMQFILELAKSLKVDPCGCFRQFFAKIKQYQDAFSDELQSFKERVRGRAKLHIKKEHEEEERQKRLGREAWTPRRCTSPCLRSALMRRTSRCCRTSSARWIRRSEQFLPPPSSQLPHTTNSGAFST